MKEQTAGSGRLVVFSGDSDVHRLCRELVTSSPDVRERGWQVIPGVHREWQEPGDICLWDYDPELPPPESRDDGCRHFYLVDPKHLDQFHASMETSDASLLLKPVTRAALRAVIGTALSSESDVDRELNKLRADRDDILQSLIQANLKLQQYDQERTNFLARAVHDFRMPLTTLTGYFGLLLGGQLGPVTDAQSDVLKRMHYSVKRLSRMANSMFLLSIGRNVTYHANWKENDINECVEQAVHEVFPASNQKHIALSADLKPSPRPLYFEKSQIEQVMVNLLDNSIKFTPKHGSIEITGYPYFWERRMPPSARGGRVRDRRQMEHFEPNCYRVDVRDNGPGIHPDLLYTIFEEYTSYAGGHDRSGGGLGLAICKLVLDRHQGHIWAENSADGAVFSFVLPYGIVATAAPPVPPSKNHV